MNSQQGFHPSSSSSGTVQPKNPTDESSGKSPEMRAKAAEAVSKFADVAQQAGSQAKQTVSSLASDAQQKAKGFLNQRVATGADMAGHVAESAKCAADNLDKNAPQLADLVRGAADKVEEFSHELRGKSADELLRSASDFTRRQPALVFGLASLAGFLLFRVLKADPTDASELTDQNYRQGGAGQFPGAGQFHGT